VYFFGPSYYAFIPGFIGYFFGYATASSPFYRQLFSLSDAPKGATAALISLFTMLIQSVGIELSNHIFDGHHFQSLAWFLLSIGAALQVLTLLNAKQTEPTEGEVA
jgi:hypothetical protein